MKKLIAPALESEAILGRYIWQYTNEKGNLHLENFTGHRCCLQR